MRGGIARASRTLVLCQALEPLHHLSVHLLVLLRHELHHVVGHLRVNLTTHVRIHVRLEMVVINAPSISSMVGSLGGPFPPNQAIVLV